MESGTRAAGLGIAGALVAALMGGLAWAEPDQAVLRVEVEGLGPQSPRVYVSVYADADSWLGEEHAADAQIDPATGQLAVDIPLPSGEYAFTAYLDSNRNGKLDTNFIGIPKEPVALSNGARPRFGPPKFADAAFSLDREGVTQTIRLEAP
jgi:uncharacterized protein (DUF2141 family)